MKKIFLFSVILLTGLFALPGIAQKPFSEPLEGQFHSYSTFSVGSCRTSEMTVKYRLSTIVGQPTVFLNLKWKAYSVSNDDCLNEEPFEMFIEVLVNGGYVYIPASGALGATPKGDNTWGNNPLAGSPDWDELFLQTIGGIKAGKNDKRSYVDADIAKSYWKSGYMKVTSVVMIDKNGDKHSIR